jgi:Glycosyl hydrolase family 9/Cellulase N-terminal ig-like domain
VIMFSLVLLSATAAPPVILTNHLGYEAGGPKTAVVQGHAGDKISACALEDTGSGEQISTRAPVERGAVDRWRDWVYWTLDFTSATRVGEFRLACTTARGEIRSFPFIIQKDILERHTLSDVIYYFKSQRSVGAFEQADRALPVKDRPHETVDARGAWNDATGDYGKHLSHLSFSTYFNPQQTSLTVWGLVKAHDLLALRHDPNFKQYLWRLRDEIGWGADFLVRMKAPHGSFYRSVQAPGPEKRAADRHIETDMQAFTITAGKDHGSEPPTVAGKNDAAYQTSLRAGAGVAIAALARASTLDVPGERKGDYLRTAEEAWAFLAKNNLAFTNDGKENIVDDYCALLAATELYRATKKAEYKSAADERARRLIARLAPSPRAYWRADDKDRPFFHAADAGLPAVSLLGYAEIADGEEKSAALAAVRRSLEWELAVTAEVTNPFGYARQLVQHQSGARDTRFFFPHDTEAAPWWQGENARLGSLAAAARLALPHFAADAAFTARLRRYATDQLDWILGRNPFDRSMLRGTGRNNPEYLFFDTYQYTPAPGGICNGITSGFADDQGIDFDPPSSVTKGDHDWRWLEQWLPHDTWYLLAVAAGGD